MPKVRCACYANNSSKEADPRYARGSTTFTYAPVCTIVGQAFAAFPLYSTSVQYCTGAYCTSIAQQPPVACCACASAVHVCVHHDTVSALQYHGTCLRRQLLQSASSSALKSRRGRCHSPSPSLPGRGLSFCKIPSTETHTSAEMLEAAVT